MRFSVVVPVYNCIAALPECVRGIREQTFGDFELILVDDGSTDGSGQMCDRLRLEDSRIRVLNKENGGASSARNAGLERARGEYLLFFDGDDWVEPDCLETLAMVLERERKDMVIFGMAFDYYEGGTLHHTQHLVYPREAALSAGEVARNIEDFFACNSLSSACNKCFRRDVVQTHGLRFREGMTLYEDLDFVLRYLCHGQTVEFVPRCWYHYRLENGPGNLAARVRVLDRLAENLSLLQASAAAFGKAAGSDRPMEMYRGIHAQLLYRHLLENRYDAPGLERACKAFLEKAPLGAEHISGAEGEMAALIRSGQYRKLKSWLTGKRLARSLRRQAKGIARALHLKK